MKILYLDLDSTNPDHLGCYGYHRNTSPNIDKIAEEGVRFENYYTSDAPCFPSRTALMTGRHGIHNGVVNHGGVASELIPDGEERGFRNHLAFENFPNIFREKDMHTTLISPFAERHSAFSFYAGFNEIYNTGNRGMESAHEVTPLVKDWLKRNEDRKDWFLYVNYWDPHTPYRTPQDYGNPFEDEPLPEWLNEETLERHKNKIGPHSVHEINMYNSHTSPEYPKFPGEIKDMQDMKKMVDGYDTGIKYVDDYLGEIFSQLEKQNIMDEVVIIVTADHGENIGELGIYGEHGTADKGTCRIPMIIRWPGKVSSHVDWDFHYHLDLLPTMSELLNVKKKNRWDGESYANVLEKGESQGREYLVVSQCAHVCQRSVRFDNWLYIRTYHDGYHLFPKEMLYDLKNDPFEQNDLAKEYPNICKDAVYKLMDWHDEMMNTMDRDIDPLWSVMKEGGPFHARGSLPIYISQLKATGREYAIPELKRRHPEEFQ